MNNNLNDKNVALKFAVELAPEADDVPIKDVPSNIELTVGDTYLCLQGWSMQSVQG
jgi:hypothetical protein